MEKLIAIVLAVFAVMLHCCAAQRVHFVGDGVGWAIPPNNSVSYLNWASAKTFMVGDILVFNFMTNQHDVVEVPQTSYDTCSQDNAIGNIITTGPANITLDSTGNHYYICTFGSHCQAGQRLAITVGSSTPGAANPPMPVAPPATPTTPSPASPQPEDCAPTPSSTPSADRPVAAGPTSPAGPPPPDSASTSVAASFWLLSSSAFMVLMF